MRCEEIRKRDVECVSPQDNVQTAARRMRDENVGFLPVCGDDKKVVGTVTDRDLAIRVVAENRVPLSTKVGDVLTREVIACRPADDVKKAQQLMAKHHKSRMIVIDDSDRVIGVISLSDIAQRFSDAGETLREVSERESHP